jgi:hypothetical protein
MKQCNSESEPTRSIYKSIGHTKFELFTEDQLNYTIRLLQIVWLRKNKLDRTKRRGDKLIAIKWEVRAPKPKGQEVCCQERAGRSAVRDGGCQEYQ